MRYWKRVKDGQTSTVESYSHDLEIVGAIEITRVEFDAFIASLPVPVPVLPRDLAAEIDDMRRKLVEKGVLVD